MLRGVAVAVLLALASPARADEPPESADLEAGQPAPADGPWMRADVGLATATRCKALELQLHDSQRQRDELQLHLEAMSADAAPATSTSVAVVLAGAVGFVAGLLAGGWLVLRATR